MYLIYLNKAWCKTAVCLLNFLSTVVMNCCCQVPNQTKMCAQKWLRKTKLFVKEIVGQSGYASISVGTLFIEVESLNLKFVANW